MAIASDSVVLEFCDSERGPMTGSVRPTPDRLNHILTRSQGVRARGTFEKHFSGARPRTKEGERKKAAENSDHQAVFWHGDRSAPIWGVLRLAADARFGHSSDCCSCRILFSSCGREKRLAAHLEPFCHLRCRPLHRHKVPRERVSYDEKFEGEVERLSDTVSESVCSTRRAGATFLHFVAECVC